MSDDPAPLLHSALDKIRESTRSRVSADDRRALREAIEVCEALPAPNLAERLRKLQDKI